MQFVSDERRRFRFAFGMSNDLIAISAVPLPLPAAPPPLPSDTTNFDRQMQLNRACIVSRGRTTTIVWLHCELEQQASRTIFSLSFFFLLVAWYCSATVSLDRHTQVRSLLSRIGTNQDKLLHISNRHLNRFFFILSRSSSTAPLLLLFESYSGHFCAHFVTFFCYFAFAQSIFSQFMLLLLLQLQLQLLLYIFFSPFILRLASIGSQVLVLPLFLAFLANHFFQSFYFGNGSPSLFEFGNFKIRSLILHSIFRLFLFLFFAFSNFWFALKWFGQHALLDYFMRIK